MKSKWVAGLLAGIMVLLGAGCAKEVIPPSAVIPDAAPLAAKIDAAVVKATANQQTMQWWDVYLPYIELAEYPESGPGVWFIALVDASGEYVWHYSSDLKEYRINAQALKPKLQKDFQAIEAQLAGGEAAWGEVYENDNYRAVLYFAPVPEPAQIQREDAPHPQYLALLIVDRLPQD